MLACLGLFGLASFSAEQRTKEIGIRKALGASVPDITAILSKEFLMWVVLSNIVALPAAWYLMHNWLEAFAYRISMSWWMFALAGGSALLIAVGAVSFRAMKAATANPVVALRYE
jgi:putative ABC transport system permease protein